MIRESSMTTVMITGASRGLGFEFVRQYSEVGAHVIALCRDPDGAEALQAIATADESRMAIHRLDVCDFNCIDELAAELASEKIDILINNAGIGGPRGQVADALNFDGWNEVFATNVYAPIKISLAFADHVAASDEKKIVTVSSGLGSIGGNRGGGGGYAYNASKAAVNRSIKQLSIDLHPRNIIIAALAPGWVRTDMGGSSAMYSPEESIAGMRKVIDGLTPETSGSFINHKGESVPW